MFVSNRKRSGSKNDNWFNDQYTDLYYAELTEDNELETLFAKELIADLHLGPLALIMDLLRCSSPRTKRIERKK